MKVGSPVWHLKITCPCCGQGNPMLISCPTCEHVAAACEEVGNIFLDPRDLTGNLCTGGIATCPSCGTRDLQEFVPASSLQIRKAGLDGLYD